MERTVYKIQTEDVNSFQKYLECINKASEQLLDTNMDHMVIYRGQSVNKPLYPKIGRLEYLSTNCALNEYRIFTDFKRLCHPFININNWNDWDILAYAQHYSLPTRLLDWTENPLMALWFAFYEEKSQQTLRTVWCYSFKHNEIVDSNTGNPFDQTKTLVFQPKHISQRIVSQKGWFTSLYYSKERNKFTALNFRRLSRNKLFQITFKKADENFRIKVLNTLDIYGINYYSIFPDLEGLCRYLEWKNYNR